MEGSGDNVVEVHTLTAGYGERVVLSGASLAVRRGEVHVILGGSGSGKSTLLKHIVGLHRPMSGTVRLLGVDQAGAREAEWENVLTRIGLLFQGGALINSITVHENVALPIVERTPNLGGDVVDEMVRMKLDLVGLRDAGVLFPPELSGGMRKRVALARAMALDPEVLFCDEPSAGLDPVTAAGIDRLILGLRERFGMAVVVVTHELASIEAIADSVTMLADGQVVAQGPYRDVRRSEQPEVRQFFNRVAAEPSAGHTNLYAALGGLHP